MAAILSLPQCVKRHPITHQPDRVQGQNIHYRVFIMSSKSDLCSLSLKTKGPQIDNIAVTRHWWHCKLLKWQLKVLPVVQIMACWLASAKPLSKPMLEIVNWTLTNELQRNFNWNSYIFIQENAFENAKWWPFCLGLNVFNWIELYHRHKNPDHLHKIQSSFTLVRGYNMVERFRSFALT